MRQCIFARCKSRPDDRVGNVALVHRFPQQEHIQKQWVQWVREKCGMPNFEYSTKAGLCYRHFERHCYHHSNGLLKPFSYPSFTPQDIDNISRTGLSAEGLPRNIVPKTNLVIKVDPTLVKNSTLEKSDPGKKLVFLVTDKGMRSNQIINSPLSCISQTETGIGLIQSQNVPPLRYIGRERAAPVLELTPSNEEKSTPVMTAVCQSDRPESCNEDAAVTRSHRTLSLIQTVLNSSRRRIHLYRKRLQQEKKKTNKLEELIDELKQQQLISAAVAEKIEAVLHDD